MSGKRISADMMVMTLKVLMESKDFLVTMSFERTLRLWNVRLEAIAAANPTHEKLISPVDAKMTPPTIGRSVAMTRGDARSLRKMAEKSTEKKGSMALMVWVKETGTEPRERFVRTFPNVWTRARGRIWTSADLVIVGKGCRRRVHIKMQRAEPNMNWRVVHVTGCGKAPRTCLL